MRVLPDTPPPTGVPTQVTPPQNDDGQKVPPKKYILPAVLHKITGDCTYWGGLPLKNEKKKKKQSKVGQHGGRSLRPKCGKTDVQKMYE